MRELQVVTKSHAPPSSEGQLEKKEHQPKSSQAHIPIFLESTVIRSDSPEYC